MTETVKYLRVILQENLEKQLKTDYGIDNRINLYMVEVQFIKDVIASITGNNNEDDELHDFACSLVDEIHNKFGN